MSADLVARLRAAAAPLTAEQWMGGDTQDGHYTDLCAEAADRIEELVTAIFGCGCPAPYDQCPHGEPLTNAILRLSTEAVELHTEVQRLRDITTDVLWLTRLAVGSSWPGEMAERVERAAARIRAALGDPEETTDD